jgi:thymidylate synthase
MKEYLALANRVLSEGTWVHNARTGKRCLTVIGATMTYDMHEMRLPVLTTKKMYWKPAIGEMLGYLRGYSSAGQFRSLGVNTWNANANAAAWLANPFCEGPDSMGRAYGVQGRAWRNPEGRPIDQLRKIVDHLTAGIDDRREILTFWNPGELDRMCLPACMHTHTFSLLGDQLYLTSAQRSDDLALGHGFNAIQVGWLLAVMAQITGKRPARARHEIVNIHLYEDQVALMRDVQLPRTPFELPVLKINPDIRTLEDLETWVTLDDFELEQYEHHPAIKYPFSV